MTEQLLHINDITMAVETFGHTTDPALILVAGAGSSMLAWDRDLCDRLAAQGFLVVRYDHRDSGRSTSFPVGQPGYGLRDLLADAVGVLDALGIDRAHWWGMSMGAAITQLAALEHPDRVTSIVLESATPGGPGHPTPDLPTMTDELHQLFGQEDPGPTPDWSNHPAVVSYLTDSERPFAGPDGIDETALNALHEHVVARTTDLPAAVTNHFLADPGQPWRQRLDQITVPTLVVHGTHDPLFPVEHGHQLAREIPGASLHLLDRTGHQYPQLPTWDDLIATLSAHFNTSARTPHRER